MGISRFLRSNLTTCRRFSEISFLLATDSVFYCFLLQLSDWRSSHSSESEDARVQFEHLSVVVLKKQLNRRNPKYLQLWRSGRGQRFVLGLRGEGAWINEVCDLRVPLPEIDRRKPVVVKYIWVGFFVLFWGRLLCSSYTVSNTLLWFLIELRSGSVKQPNHLVVMKRNPSLQLAVFAMLRVQHCIERLLQFPMLNICCKLKGCNYVLLLLSLLVFFLWK